VSDERAVEAFFFNTYLNEIFQSELSAGTAIRPITAMSIGEFEEILPYVSGNIFSWEELLQRRFNQAQVNAFSVHQTIFDLLQSKGMQPQRNESLSKKYDEIGRIISSRYKQPAT